MVGAHRARLDVDGEYAFQSLRPGHGSEGFVRLSLAIVCFDAVRVKIRDEGLVRNKAVYLAIGYTCDGLKQILGMWIEQTEGANFWLSPTYS